MIDIKDLSFRYPGADVDALQKISLTIAQGGIFGLLGPNGAGKTTLISLLSGLLDDSDNRIKINGADLTQAAKIKPSLLGYIPQEYAFYPNMSARENLVFFAGVQGLCGEYKEDRIAFGLEFCQLSSVADQRAETFSGGLKRRLNIAIGLLTDPDIILFDEPTVGIDPQSRAFILDQIKILSESGKTIIYTSHYMEEIEKLCDQLAIIDAGQVLTQGSLFDLKQAQKSCLRIELCEPLTDEKKAALPEHSSNGIYLTVYTLKSAADAHQWLQNLSSHGIELHSFSYGGGDLESLFLQLTQRSLRD